jgi:hypothetical protein
VIGSQRIEHQKEYVRPGDAPLAIVAGEERYSYEAQQQSAGEAMAQSGKK